MNADGSNQVQISKVEGGYPRFVTADGKWVYFESGLHQSLWRVSTDGREETQAAAGRLFYPALSLDGKLCAYFFRAEEGDDRIAVLLLEKQKVLNTFSLNSDQAVKIAWAPDNRTLYYITTRGTKYFLWRRSFENPKPELISEVVGDEIEDFAISPDGSSFGFIRGRWLHDAVLIEGLH